MINDCVKSAEYKVESFTRPVVFSVIIRSLYRGRLDKKINSNANVAIERIQT